VQLKESENCENGIERGSRGDKVEEGPCVLESQQVPEEAPERQVNETGIELEAPGQGAASEVHDAAQGGEVGLVANKTMTESEKKHIYSDFVKSLPDEFSRVPDPPVDPKLAARVEKWIEVKNKGLTIVDDLRRRKWYMSPDCMQSMMDKFDIVDGGTNLEDSSGVVEDVVDIYEMRRALEEHESRKKSERASGSRQIEFSKGEKKDSNHQAAVAAAVAAAQAKAAAFSAAHRS